MTHVETVEFEPGDPHNDQMAARANDELDQHLKSVRDTLRQANGSATDAMVVVAVTLIKNDDLYPRDRLASILAAALVRLAGLPPSGRTSDTRGDTMTQDQSPHERLVAALRARLEVARALGGETWYPAFYSSMDEWRVRDRRTQEPRAEVVDDDDAERRAQFIAANDPATEIRRVEALLRVVERHRFDAASVLNPVTGKPYGPGSLWAGTEPMEYPDPSCGCGGVWPCDDIRDLAAGEGIE